MVDSKDKEKINLILGEVKMEAERELPKYFVSEESPRFVRINEGEAVKMEILLKRTLTSETMKTFIPSLLLVCFSYATSFFRLPNFFNAAIAANLTVMLTMTNLIKSVLQRLPQTSYIKWIEYWLLFTQFIPFVQVILITTIEWLRNQEEIENQKKEKLRSASEEAVLERGTEICEIGTKLVKVKKHVCSRKSPIQYPNNHV